MKLQTKIILTSTVLLFILLVIANSSVYFIFKKTMEDNAIERLQAETSNVTNGLKQTSSTVKQSNLLRAYLPPNGMIRILPKSGSPLVVSVTDQRKSFRPCLIPIIQMNKQQSKKTTAIYTRFHILPSFGRTVKSFLWKSRNNSKTWNNLYRR